MAVPFPPSAKLPGDHGDGKVELKASAMAAMVFCVEEEGEGEEGESGGGALGRRRSRARASRGDIKERRRSPVRHIQLQGDVEPGMSCRTCRRRKGVKAGLRKRDGPDMEVIFPINRN